MKHGPIALINEGMPVLFVATKCNQYDKVISNIEEVRARGGEVIAVATEGDSGISATAITSCMSPMSWSHFNRS